MKTRFNILIAGHGYLGQPLARTLVADGHSVFAITKSVGFAPVEDYTLISCDLGDLNALATIEFQPDVVIHCASSSRGGVDAYRTVFCDGIANLTTTFPNTHVFLTSSTSVYNQTDGLVVDENSPAEPDREAGQFLREAEETLLAADGTVLRLAGIYGPKRSVYLKRLFEGTARIESGAVSRYLNQIHLADIISAIKILMSPISRGQIYNVVDETPMTQRECYEGLAAIFEKPIPPEAKPEMNGKRAWTNKKVSAQKLIEAGWQPKYPSFFDAVKNEPTLVASIPKKG